MLEFYSTGESPQPQQPYFPEKGMWSLKGPAQEWQGFFKSLCFATKNKRLKEREILLTDYMADNPLPVFCLGMLNGKYYFALELNQGNFFLYEGQSENCKKADPILGFLEDTKLCVGLKKLINE